MQRLASTLATVWRLAVPYFRSEDRWAGRILLAAVVAIELAIVGLTVLFNQWNNRFYNALQERDWPTFVSQLEYFCVLATAFMALAVYQLYLNQWLQIRWRRWLTEHYLGQWLNGANHYRMQLLGDEADNPDQRIADDINQFIDRTLTIGLGFLNSVVTLCSFVVILWALSAEAPLQLFGVTVSIPGYLVWAALVYALLGTIATHLVGWPLITLNFQQQRFEADFRFNLVRVRENSEQIALLHGENAETERLLDRFGNIVTNWLAIMRRTKTLTFLTAGYTQASVVFPFIMVSPAYFAGAMQLGGLMQTVSAFSSVQSALSFIITTYRQLAEWRAVVARLEGFQAAVARGQAVAAASTSIHIMPREGRNTVEIEDLLLRLPQGAPLAAADHIVISAGDKVLVTGPSGTGKSTLFRSIAGIWPFGAGSIVVPKGAKLMTLPQRPYFPIGTLAGAITYPAERGSFSHERLAETIAEVGLPALVGRLDEEAHWNRILSMGEQQRLGIARAILQAPDYLFLDEATASLDEAAEAALYRSLHERLEGATIVSIGHRSTLTEFHRSNLVMVREGDQSRLRAAGLTPADSPVK